MYNQGVKISFVTLSSLKGMMVTVYVAQIIPLLNRKKKVEEQKMFNTNSREKYDAQSIGFLKSCVHK